MLLSVISTYTAASPCFDTKRTHTHIYFTYVCSTYLPIDKDIDNIMKRNIRFKGYYCNILRLWHSSFHHHRFPSYVISIGPTHIFILFDLFVVNLVPYIFLFVFNKYISFWLHTILLHSRVLSNIAARLY